MMEGQLKIRIGTIATAGFALICSAGAAFGQYAGPAITTMSPQAGAPVSAMHVRQSKTVIEPGDQLSINAYGLPELSSTANGVGELRVSDQGTVILPYLGTVRLAGMTASEASIDLAKKLKQNGILVNPQVSVQVLSSPTQEITVVGQVMKPKPVPDFGLQLRLLDVISACGGFTPLASHTVIVHRQGETQPITVNLGVDPRTTDATNIPLLAGDTVVVPEVGNAYIVGQVQRPKAIPLSSNAPITVIQAISMTGGLKYGAALSKAMIIRTTANRQRVEIRFNLNKVMRGKEKDIALMSNDILYIPMNSFKAAMSNGAGPQTAVYAAAVSLGYVVP